MTSFHWKRVIKIVYAFHPTANQNIYLKGHSEARNYFQKPCNPNICDLKKKIMRIYIT